MPPGKIHLARPASGQMSLLLIRSTTTLLVSSSDALIRWAVLLTPSGIISPGKDRAPMLVPLTWVPTVSNLTTTGMGVGKGMLGGGTTGPAMICPVWVK